MLNDPFIHELPFAAWPVWARAIFWIWIAFLGGAIGSFLNVVIYRVPRRMSLIHPGSQCPKCGHAIRARDNLPVVGWLVLGGKCRDCGAAIASRYPLVEAVVGLLFIGLAALYFGWQGESLPRPSDKSFTTLWSEKRLLFICAFHLVLITFLLAAAGMRMDGQAMPNWLVALIGLFGLLIPCIWPSLQPLDSGLKSLGSPNLDALFSGLIGGCVGVVATGPRAVPTIIGREFVPSFVGDLRIYAVIGIFLGWQGVLAVITLASLLGLIFALTRRLFPRLVDAPDEFGLLLAVLSLFVGWRWGIDWLARVGLQTWVVAIIAIVLIRVLSTVEIAVRIHTPVTTTSGRRNR